ncbi:MAG: ATP-binding protein [Pseudomonadota bacterium]
MTDTGCGMAPEVIEHAFEPFFTTKPEGRGTGLGLSQVFGFMKQSGGHVKIYSELDHGTTVRLYLPPALVGIADAEERSAADPSPRGTETLLVVEDDPTCAPRSSRWSRISAMWSRRRPIPTTRW